MECNLVKEKLIDYIEGVLDREEKDLITNHLIQCEKCNGEHSEINSTIDYLADNSNKIDTSSDINIKPYKNKSRVIRKFTRTGLIAVVLSLILVITAYGTDIFDFMKLWQKSSEIRKNAWEKLIDSGVGDKLDISVIDNDIKVTAEGVIADEINTVILLRIEDLEGNIRFTPSFYGEDENQVRAITIEGDIENHPVAKEPIFNYIQLYTEEKNTLRLMLVADPLTKDVGNIKINITKLMDILNRDKESKVIKEGNWDIEISAKKIKSKQFEIDEVIDLDGNEIRIKKITLAPTETNIEYEFNTYNSKKKYFLNSLSFLIEYDKKIYGNSIIGISYNSYHNGNRTVTETNSLESLYLEDPSEINLIIEQYRYSNKIFTSKGDKRYKIDFNNLPQVIEYNNSKITIEDIIYNEESVEIIIKEDDSKDRKYIRTDMHIAYDNDERGITGFYSRDIEYAFRDDKGRIINIEDELNNKNVYRFVTRQKIEIKRETDLEIGIEDDMIDQGILYIQGQRFIAYPNKKITIMLK